jgi:GT2 family glycosyltransferase
MSFRMSLLKSVGGFDTMYLDNAHRCETDLSYRIMAAGYRIVFRTKASLIHFYTPAGGSRSKSTFFRSVESFSNSFRFFYKNLNHSKRVLFNFYIINILFIIRRPNPAIMYERFRYLIEGSRKAQKELNDNSLQIKATEISVPITL